VGEQAERGACSCQTPWLLFRSCSERKKHWNDVSAPGREAPGSRHTKLLHRNASQSGSAEVARVLGAVPWVLLKVTFAPQAAPLP